MLRLHELAKQGQHSKKIVITECLPFFLQSPCEVQATYLAEATEDYYVLQMRVAGDVTVICQRCAHEFKLNYDNATTLAVCKTEARAEQLQEMFECIVSADGLVDLDDLIRDDLHLYAPQSHPDSNDCDKEVIQILT